MTHSTKFNKPFGIALRGINSDTSCVICHRIDGDLTLIPVDARGRIAEGRAGRNYFISVIGHRPCVRANARRTRGSRRYGSVRKMIYERDGYQCVWCHAIEGDVDENLRPITLTLDHIRPQSRKGNDHPDNLRTLCKPCNQKKGNRLDEELEWLPELLARSM